MEGFFMFDEMDRKGKWVIFLVITNIICVGFIIYLLNQTNETKVLQEEWIYVQISGEVNDPNVFRVERGTRLNQLIELAGGFTENANIDAVNLTILLNDEMKIKIPKMIVDDPNQKENGLININTADKTLLMTLKGIGEVKAEAIISFREKNGFFNSIEEIQFVSGIGEITYENIKDFICC